MIRGGRGFLNNNVDEIRQRLTEDYPNVAKNDSGLFEQLVNANFNKNRSISLADRKRFRELEASLKGMLESREAELIYAHRSKVARERMTRNPSTGQMYSPKGSRFTKQSKIAKYDEVFKATRSMQKILRKALQTASPSRRRAILSRLTKEPGAPHPFIRDW